MLTQKDEQAISLCGEKYVTQINPIGHVLDFWPDRQGTYLLYVCRIENMLVVEIGRLSFSESEEMAILPKIK